MAVAEHPFPDRLYPSLPSGRARIGRAAVFEKQQAAAGFQDAVHFPQDLRMILHRTQGEGAYHAVELTIIKRDRFPHPLADIAIPTPFPRRAAPRAKSSNLPDGSMPENPVTFAVS